MFSTVAYIMLSTVTNNMFSTVTKIMFRVVSFSTARREPILCAASTTTPVLLLGKRLMQLSMGLQSCFSTGQ